MRPCWSTAPDVRDLAVVRVLDPMPEVDVLEVDRRMTCTACFHTAEEAAHSQLQWSLRLAAQTRHGTLYAYNAEHLEYLASYIGGRLRREVPGTSSVRNRSQLSRLPAWVKSAKNREQSLKAIERLRCEKL